MSSSSGSIGQENTQRQAGTGPMIQPAQATRLVQELKNELALAKGAGNDRAAAQQHYMKAEQIKQVLLRYRAQQQAKQQQNLDQLGTQSQQQVPNQFNTISQSSPLPQTQNIPPSGIRPSNTAPPLQQLSSQGSRQGSPEVNGQISIENFNQVKSRLSLIDSQIKQLTSAKNSPNLTQEQHSAIDAKLADLRGKYTKCQKIAVIIRDQLLKKNGNQAVPTGQPNSTAQVPAGLGATANTAPQQLQRSGSTPTVGPATTQSPALQNKSTPTMTPASATPSGGVNAASAAANAAHATTTPNTAVANANANTSNSVSDSKVSSPSNKKPSGPPSINLSGITKPSVPSIPISSSISVNPPNPITLKPGNISRATLTGGSANGLGQVVGTPAIVRMPTFDLATTGAGPISDNGGRVLTKRKLSELVNTIGADEGDGKTTIDGDVEELLLDLADEFITSVTGFACRLAKHRKTDAIDVKDVQLHLERNWNIRIPGYAMDEVRATRRWQPNSAYNQKMLGVEISKSVNGNIN